MQGNFHAQFSEGWTGAIPSGYSVTRKQSKASGVRPIFGFAHYCSFRALPKIDWLPSET